MSRPVTVDPSRPAGAVRPAWVIAGGSLVVLVSLFLDWISVSCSGPFCGVAGTVGGSGFHGWSWLVFLGLLGAVVLLALRTVLRGSLTVPPLPAPDAVIFMALGGLEVLGCLLFWLQYHDGFVTVSLRGNTVSVGPGVGWFLALLGAAATILGGYLDRPEAALSPPVPPPASWDSPGGG